MRLRVWTDAVLLPLFGAACAACKQPLTSARRGAICQPCWTSIRRITLPWCDRCGEPARTWRAVDGWTCAACLHAPPRYDAARAPAIYTGTMREIVHAMKYGQQVLIAEQLGAMMRESAGDWLDRGVAVPVPLHPFRSLRRGFNQADALARALRMPIWRGLTRRRLSAPQTGLSPEQRRRNVEGAFDLRLSSRHPPQVVVLIDDVMTTGATANACAAVLKAHGTREVLVLTAARAVKGVR